MRSDSKYKYCKISTIVKHFNMYLFPQTPSEQSFSLDVCGICCFIIICESNRSCLEYFMIGIRIINHEECQKNK